MKPSHLISRLVASVAVLAMMSALPAAAVQAPRQAIGKATAAIVWVDLEQVTPQMIESIGVSLAGLGGNPALEQVGGALPLGDIERMVEQATAFRKGFVQAGGSGLMLALEMPEGQQSWSPPMSLFAQSEGPIDAEAMTGLMKQVSGGAVERTSAVPLDGGWHALTLTGPEGRAVTQALPVPDDVAFKAFDRQLNGEGKPVVRVALRVQDALRAMAGGVQAGAGAEGADPNVAMAAAMLEPLKALDTVGVSVTQLKGEPNNAGMEIDVQLVFLDQQSAAMFANLYNTLLMIAPASLAQQLANAPDAPNANEINQFFMKLKMTQQGEALRLKLDREFFDMAEELQQKLQPIAPPPADKGDVPI